MFSSPFNDSSLPSRTQKDNLKPFVESISRDISRLGGSISSKDIESFVSESIFKIAYGSVGQYFSSGPAQKPTDSDIPCPCEITEIIHDLNVRAKLLKKLFAKAGASIQLGAAKDSLARSYGFKDWNVLIAKTKAGELPFHGGTKKDRYTLRDGDPLSENWPFYEDAAADEYAVAYELAPGVCYYHPDYAKYGHYVFTEAAARTLLSDAARRELYKDEEAGATYYYAHEYDDLPILKIEIPEIMGEGEFGGYCCAEAQGRGVERCVKDIDSFCGRKFYAAARGFISLSDALPMGMHDESIDPSIELYDVTTCMNTMFNGIVKIRTCDGNFHLVDEKEWEENLSKYPFVITNFTVLSEQQAREISDSREEEDDVWG